MPGTKKFSSSSPVNLSVKFKLLKFKFACFYFGLA